MAEDTCLVFRPTEEEFANFREYLERLNFLHPEIGICKIIPPPSWKLLPIDINSLKQRVSHPVAQYVSGKHGIFSVELLEQRSMSVAAFERLARKSEFINPDFRERERRFWKHILGNSGYGVAMYGADVIGSLFQGQNSHSAWNLNKLDNILQAIPQKLPGVNAPMLYFGTWRALFAFHVEDVDLYSINYLHLGAAKSWYSIAPADRRRFEQMAEKFFPGEYTRCHEFLRHKTKLFSPFRLQQERIPYETVVQLPGEFIITFPGSYHAGFNHGFNIAEATNFALHHWLDIGRQAYACSCVPDSVNLDVNAIETLHIREIVRCLKAKKPISPWANRILPSSASLLSSVEDSNLVPALKLTSASSENYIQSTGGPDVVERTILDDVNDICVDNKTLHRSTSAKATQIDAHDPLRSLNYRLRCVCHWDVRYCEPHDSASSIAANSTSSPSTVLSVPPQQSSDTASASVTGFLFADSGAQTKQYVTVQTDHEGKSLQQCSDCWLWFHPECVKNYNSLLEMKKEGDDVNVGEESRCSVCHTIALHYSTRKRRLPSSPSTSHGPSVGSHPKSQEPSITNWPSTSPESSLSPAIKKPHLDTQRFSGLQVVPATIIYSIAATTSL
jgi:jumonji domain-containing protein 2